MSFVTRLGTIGRNDEGATAIEYGLIASLIVIAAVGAFQAVAEENTKKWDHVTNTWEDAADKVK